MSRGVGLLAQLDLPDMLADGPLTVTELASRTAVDAAALRRLLRAMAAYDVFSEPVEDTFALAPLGRTPCADAVASVRPSALLVAGVVGSTWEGLARTLRTGEPAFDDVFGRSFFSYLEQDAFTRETFSWSQAHGLALEADEILLAVDFSAYRTIVDVDGGGDDDDDDDALLTHILHKHPNVRGVLFDLPRNGLAGATDDRVRGSRFALRRGSGRFLRRCSERRRRLPALARAARLE